MLGIEPTHMEELRKKQGLKLVVEENAVNVGKLLAIVGHKVCDGIDVLHSFGKKSLQFIVNHKQYTWLFLFSVLVIYAMVS